VACSSRRVLENGAMDGFRPFLLTIFLVGFVATIAVARRFRLNRYRLDTSRARRGIICLEVASSAGWASEIIASWRAERLLDNFRPNIALDSRFFIPCYTL